MAQPANVYQEVAEQEAPQTPRCSARQATWANGYGPSEETTPPRVKQPYQGTEASELNPFKASIPQAMCDEAVTGNNDVGYGGLPPGMTAMDHMPPLGCYSHQEMCWGHAYNPCDNADIQVCSDIWFPTSFDPITASQMQWDPMLMNDGLAGLPSLSVLDTVFPPGLEDGMAMDLSTQAAAGTWCGAWPAEANHGHQGDNGAEWSMETVERAINEHAVCEKGAQQMCTSSEAGEMEQAEAKPTALGQAWRYTRVVKLLQEALKDCADSGEADADGYVQVTRLLKRSSDMQRETFGSVRVALQAIEGQTEKIIRLDKGRRRARLATPEEIFGEESDRLLSAALANEQGELSASQGKACGVALDDVLAAPALQAVLEGKKGTRALALRAVQNKDSDVILTEDNRIIKKPRFTQLRRIAESLFSDEHLKSDQRLRAKIMESSEGEVPLAWLCSRYAAKLSGERAAGSVQSPEAAAADLCEALANSDVVLVDRQKLTISRRQQLSIEEVGGWMPNKSGRETADKKPMSSARGCATLRQLLDFYFEPFTLQHNRYLRDLVAKNLGPPEEAGPWLQRDLKRLIFSLEDLSGLGRVSAALGKIRGGVKEALQFDGWSQLKHVVHEGDGSFKLRVPPEVRSFVGAQGVDAEQVAAVTKYMTASREERGHAVAGVVTVMSYSVREALCKPVTAAVDGQCEARLKRQLLVYRTDVVCLQGLGNDAPGEAISNALAEEGYASKHLQSSATPVAIFWDRSRWELLSVQESNSALAVELRPFEDSQKVIRVVCVCPCIEQLLASSCGLPALPTASGGAEAPLVVCADLSLLGGVEGAQLVEELAGLDSAMKSIFGCELTAPPPATDGLVHTDVAHRLRNIRHPDAVLFRGLMPTAALSGHTEGYVAAMGAEEMITQFPASRIPLVAAFDW
eukprot:CAMPEP_0178389006 /NCGR_PEP_ID=MMETSP0689_2-20121128/9886_1 /TAXON_ID=160604 /ORGANISM="Amphidinium massartii, Strain CS-259" /LENGTH=916 /DNA_ID=CAMNT_0020009427 /DNA_START=56 /DNA_END=2803 /DNA_ORIENTATION=+